MSHIWILVAILVHLATCQSEGISSTNQQDLVMSISHHSHIKSIVLTTTGIFFLSDETFQVIILQYVFYFLPHNGVPQPLQDLFSPLPLRRVNRVCFLGAQ